MNDHKAILRQFFQSTKFQSRVHWKQACANELTT